MDFEPLSPQVPPQRSTKRRRQLQTIACLFAAISLFACAEKNSHGANDDALSSHSRASSSVLTPLPIPAGPGNGAAFKAVCCNASNFGGNKPLNQAEALLNGYTALKAPANPPTSISVASFALGTPLNFGLGSSAGGLFGDDIDPTNIFGTAKSNWAGLFAGYLRIDPSSDGSTIVKTFMVGSDDGFMLAISNGTAASSTMCNANRGMTFTNLLGNVYYDGCLKGLAFSQPTLQVSFPGTGGLFPFDLLYYNETGDQGLEWSWADGAQEVPDAGGQISLDGGAPAFTLVPVDHLYSPAVRATMTVADSNSSVQPGDTLTYRVEITNTGAVALSMYTFAVQVDGGLLTDLDGGPGGNCSINNTELSCPLSQILNPGDSTSGTFTAQVKTGLAAGTVIDVQGIVTGLATAPEIAMAVGGTAEQTAGEIYALTDDPNVVAGSNFSLIDTGNTPAGFAATPAIGEADDDATRVVIGNPSETAPVVTGPPNPSVSDVALAVSGTSHAPAGVTVQVSLVSTSAPTALPLNCTAVTDVSGNWSCAAQALADGTYNARASLVGGSGNSGPASAVYTFVVNPPAAPAITAPTSAQALHTSQVTFSGTASEQDNDTVRATASLASGGSVNISCDALISAGAWSCSASLPDGAYSVTAAVVEVTGALGSLSAAVPFTVSTGGACGSTIAQTSSPSNNQRPTFVGTATIGLAVQVCEGGTTPCGSGSTAICSAGTVGAAGTWSCEAASNLADGVHTAVAVASGGPSSTSCASNSDVFTIDTTAPAPPGFNPLASPTSQTTPLFSGTGEVGDTVEVGDGSAGVSNGFGHLLCTATVAANGMWSCTSSALADGSYTLQAVQIDLAMNQSAPATQPLVVNTSRPDAPTLEGPPSPTRNPVVAFTGTSDLNTDVTVRTASGNICTSTVVASGPTAGSWSCSSAVLPDGSYSFTAIATGASNIASLPSAALVIVVDTTPPAAPVLDAVPSPTAQHFPLFQGTAEAGSVVAVFEGATMLCSGPSAGTFSCVSANSLANGVHTATANATDAAGNVSAMSAPVTFTIDDTSAPAPTLDALAVPAGATPGFTDQTEPTFSGTGVPGDVVTARVVSGETLCTATVGGDGSWSCASAVMLIGQPATAYMVEAVQEAPAGAHVSAPSAPIAFTVDTHVPATPGLDAPTTPTTDHSPSFTGTAEALDAVEIEDATSGVVCTTTSSAQGTFVCMQTISLADGMYQLTARAISQAGISSASSTPPRPLTVTTPPAQLPAPTFTAPMSPTRNSRPTFSGGATAGTTITVESGGVAICDSTIASAKWSCQPAAALADGTYALTARASDATGAVSPDSNTVALVVDTTAPPSPIISAPVDGSELEDANVLANGTAQVATTVSLTLDGALFGTASVSGEGAWSSSLGTLAAGSHTLSATAADAVGNVSAPASVTFSIAAAGTVRGGCTSSAETLPWLALVALILYWPRRKMRRAFAHRSLATLSLAALFATPSRAQQIDLGRFQPASDGEGMLGVQGARAPVDGDPRASLNLWLDNAVQPLVFQPNAGGREVLIDNRVESFLSAQVHLWSPISLALQLPFLLAQTGDLSALPPSSRPSNDLGGAVGDVRITPRLAILRQENAPIDLGAEASITLPTATSAAYAGDSRTQLEMLAALGRHIAIGEQDFALLGNVLVRLRAPQQIVDVKTGNELGLRFGFAWLPSSSAAAAPRRVFVEAEATSELRAGFDAGTVPAEWRLGASFCAARAVSFDLGAGTALGNGLGAPRARFIFGLGYAPEACGTAGRDRFSSRARFDSSHSAVAMIANPPGAVAPASSSSDARAAAVVHFGATNSAPSAASASAASTAPTSASSASSSATPTATVSTTSTDLLPSSAAANSSGPPNSASGQSVTTSARSTAAAPFIASAAATDPSSPSSTSAASPMVAASPSASGELALPDIDSLPPPPLPGMPSDVRAAPGTSSSRDEEPLPLAPLVALSDTKPANAGGSTSANSLLPDSTDRDGDGISDGADSCPDSAGPMANHGCPPASKMFIGIATDRFALDRPIEFHGPALEHSAFPLLLQLATVLENHPELSRIEVRAHTGNALSEAQARKLSQTRAEAIVKFLSGHGVDPARLSASGRGASEPIAPNLTPQGRKKNERIEILIDR